MDNEISVSQLFKNVEILIDGARRSAANSINNIMCNTYYQIGKMIVEEEMKGEQRARYGAAIIKNLSEYLTEKYGRGFSTTNLKNYRKFYKFYLPVIGQTPSDQFKLSWSHYLILMLIENPEERNFYEVEAIKLQWSVKTLKREFSSSLYERLALSRDKASIQSLSANGHTIEKPRDILKNPFVLEFLDIPERESYTESVLESAIISRLQKFLLELGKGFLFEARQKRFTIDNQHFYVDLVLYNRLLQCYVLIDLKTDSLKHQDLGQMQMYVNYYDRHIKRDFEKPTIGILLCREASKSIVEMTLPENANIYASEYKLYLPPKDLLQEKLKEWTEEFEIDQI